jgi:DHA3 family macrolide efflux protein-like MFS transporter
MAANPAALLKSSPSPFAIFRNRDFTLMWIGQLIDTAGSALSSLAASIMIFRITGSALSVGLMLVATALPSLLVGLIAGVYVDRYDRKRIMIIANVLRAGLVMLIPFLVPVNIAWLYILIFVTSTVGQFFDPAHESVLPEIANDEELAAANSLMAISSFGATAIGFAASGLIASRFPIEWAFYLDAASFLFGAVCIALVRIRPLDVTGETSVKVVVQNLKIGIHHLFDTSILRSLFLVSIPVMISFGLANSLLLPFAERALHATEFEYGLQEALTSVGFVVASLIMAKLADRLREGQWLVIGFVGMAIAGMAYSFTSSVPVAIVIVMISGFLNAPASIARRLVVQRNTPREMRGRVNSAFFVSRDILFLVGMLMAGLADVINIRVMYFFSAALVLVGGVMTVLMTGLGSVAAERRRRVSLLRRAPELPGLRAGQPARLADLDTLVGLLPTLTSIGKIERETLVAQSFVMEAPAGTTILKYGDASDEAYFILAGKAIAGIAVEGGDFHALSTITPGDFFGEIGALTGARRTANVVADEPVRLLQVSAQGLRQLMEVPAFSQLVLSKMTERLNRSSNTELPRFAGFDQQALLDLRTAQPVEAAS